MAEEKTFYTDEHVTVTNSRLIALGETFAMSGVTSVKMEEEKPSRRNPILAMILGGGIAVASLFAGEMGGLLFGLLFAGAGYWLLRRQKPKYHITLRTAAGDSKAYHSTNKGEVSKIVAAINDAIVHRG
jgi:hypothetical protein